MDSIAYDYEYEAAAGRLRPVGATRFRTSPATERAIVLRRALLLCDVFSAIL